MADQRGDDHNQGQPPQLTGADGGAASHRQLMIPGDPPPAADAATSSIRYQLAGNGENEQANKNGDQQVDAPPDHADPGIQHAEIQVPPGNGGENALDENGDVTSVNTTTMKKWKHKEARYPREPTCEKRVSTVMVT